MEWTLYQDECFESAYAALGLAPATRDLFRRRALSTWRELDDFSIMSAEVRERYAQEGVQAEGIEEYGLFLPYRDKALLSLADIDRMAEQDEDTDQKILGLLLAKQAQLVIGQIIDSLEEEDVPLEPDLL